MSDLSRPTVHFAVACDDIRQENNGKFFLIGVYSDAFSPSQFPTPATLRIALFVTIESVGKHRLIVELKQENNPQIFGELIMDFETIAAASRTILPLPPINFLLGQPGDLLLLEGVDKREVMRLPVVAAGPNDA